MLDPIEQQKSADEPFERFLHYNGLGMKKEAKQAVLALVDALPNIEKKRAWMTGNLHRVPDADSNRIRHEIFKFIIFPVLKADWALGDPEASYLLGKYDQNMRDKSLSKQVNHATNRDFFRAAFEADPSSSRYRHAFLEVLMGSLHFSFHEWPDIVLVDPPNWQKGLDRLRADLAFVDSLDLQEVYSEVIAEYSEFIEEYAIRLKQQDIR